MNNSEHFTYQKTSKRELVFCRGGFGHKISLLSQSRKLCQWHRIRNRSLYWPLLYTAKQVIVKMRKRLLKQKTRHEQLELMLFQLLWMNNGNIFQCDASLANLCSERQINLGANIEFRNVILYWWYWIRRYIIQFPLTILLRGPEALQARSTPSITNFLSFSLIMNSDTSPNESMQTSHTVVLLPVSRTLKF